MSTAGAGRTAHAPHHPHHPRHPHRPRGLRTAVASSLLGTTVEWYDFFLYSTAAGLVFGELFFPTAHGTVGTMLAFATFAVGFLARPVGGLLFGHIGDRAGRKRSLAFTMGLMGVATAAIGVLPTYEQAGLLAPALLLVLRVAQGVALGGEWAGAVLLAVEYGPEGRKGRFGAVPQLGLALGLALGTGAFALLEHLLGDAAFLAWGWRVAFLVSLVLVAVGLTVRLKVDETPAFRALRERRSRERRPRAQAAPLVDLLRERDARRHVLLGMLSRWGEGAAFNTWAVFALTYATATLHLERGPVLAAVTAAALVMAAVLPVSGALTDRLGARRVYVTGMALFGLSVFPAFWAFGRGGAAGFAAVLVVTLGLVHAVFYGAQGTLFAGLFATGVRYTGMSFVYQMSGIFASGVTPLIMTALLALTDGAPWAACGYLAGTAAVSVWATTRLRERDLHVVTGRPRGAAPPPSPPSPSASSVSTAAPAAGTTTTTATTPGTATTRNRDHDRDLLGDPMSHILAVSGSPSANSRTAALVRHVGGRLEEDGHEVRHLAVRDLPAEPLLAADTAHPAVRRAVRSVAWADALVVGTPVYKAAYSGLLKTLLDLLPQSALAGRTVLPLATGGSTAHVLALDYALRPVLTALGTDSVLRGWFVLDEHVVREAEGGPGVVAPEAAEGLAQAVDRLRRSLAAGAAVRAALTPVA